MKTALAALLFTFGGLNASMACSIMKDQFDLGLRNKLISESVGDLQVALDSNNLHRVSVTKFQADLIDLPVAPGEIPCNFAEKATARIIIDATTQIWNASNVFMPTGKNPVDAFIDQNRGDSSILEKSVRCTYVANVTYDSRVSPLTQTEILRMACKLDQVK